MAEDYNVAELHPEVDAVLLEIMENEHERNADFPFDGGK